MQLVAAAALGFPQPFLQQDSVQNSPHFTDALDQEGKPGSSWKGIKVVWGTWETAPGDFQERLGPAVSTASVKELSGKLGFNNMRPHGALWGPGETRHISTTATLLEGGRQLLDYAETFGAGILVLDPLAAAYASSENDRSLVRAFLSYLADWADRTGCTVIIIAHPPKSGNDGYSGSTDWHNGVQARWLLTLCKCADEDDEPCQVQKFLVAKLSEGRLPDTALSFAWDDTQHTLVLVNHDQPQPQQKKGQGRRKAGNRGTKASQRAADDGQGTLPIPMSPTGWADDLDFDLQ